MAPLEQHNQYIETKKEEGEETGMKESRGWVGESEHSKLQPQRLKGITSPVFD